MDGASILFIVLLTLAVILFSMIISCTLCCICCTIPIAHLCSYFFNSSITSCFYKENTNHNYELIPVGAVSNQMNNNQNQEIAIAQAYLVPPLIEVQTINSANVLEHHSQTASTNNLNSVHTKEKFRDVWAAILFIMNVIIVLYFAIDSITNFKLHVDTAKNNEENTFNSNLIVEGFILIMLLTCISSTIGYFILSYLMNHAENIIEYMIWFNIITQFIFAFLCLLTLNILGVLFFGFFGCLSYWYLQSVRLQIPFSSAILATACKAIKVHYQGILTTAYSTLLIQIIWLLIWTTAMISIYKLNLITTNTNPDVSNNDDNNQDLPILLMFITFLSFYWGTEVVKALLQTTVSGTIACWWFQLQRESPVQGSFFRSITTSFGSICFGSLLVAFIQALRAILNHMRHQAQRIQSNRNSNNRSSNGTPAVLFICVIACTECILHGLEDVMKYFNKYAYCYIAAYGLGFVESGKQVTNLFTRRGWTAIINDNLISRALFCGVLVIVMLSILSGGVISLLLGAVLNHHNISEVGTLFIFGCVLGGIVGMLVGAILVHVLDSAVAMVFVCFAEDPFVLQKNHEEVYNSLSYTWEQMHPNTLQWTNATYINQPHQQPAIYTTTTTTSPYHIQPNTIPTTGSNQHQSIYIPPIGSNSNIFQPQEYQHSNATNTMGYKNIQPTAPIDNETVAYTV